MDEEIFLKFALRYSPKKLKGKYNRLRSMHTKFSELISHTGVIWDSNTGRVFANDSVWDDYFKKDRIFKSFKRKGCKLYPLLTIVFSGSTASGAFHNASTTVPQTSEEEHRLEEEYLASGEKVGESESGSKKHKLDDIDIEHGMRRVKKKSGKDQFDNVVDVFSQSIVARKERDLAKAERYKSQSSEVSGLRVEEYSVCDCMVLLDSTPDVSTKSYDNAMKHFLKLTWRKMFTVMPKNRRKAWLDSLDN